MEQKFEHEVVSIVSGSIAEEVGINPQDKIISINGKVIKDIFDYYFLMEDEYIEVLIKSKNGEEWICEIEKDYNEDLGVKFKDDLLDNYKSCRNNCIFCFIDQLPEGLRDTLYFKDDDSRLSFLKGNYITMTNMSDEDIDRIVNYHMSPINVSVHTTNPELRVKMLNNRFASKIMDNLKRLADANIKMNAQIVLCKGVNDCDELERTLTDLSQFVPNLQSLSIVPVGLSKYREGLYQLEPFNKQDATNLINQVEKWQSKMNEKYENHFVHASDEFYILADQDMPDEESYDGYLQLENGVGMTRLLINEFDEALEKMEYNENINREISLATGVLPYNYLKDLVNKFNNKFPNIKVNIYPIVNNFFGENITVSGLLTGTDIIEQLKDKSLGQKLLLPCNVLRAGEEVLLDDITVKDIENSLHIGVHIVQSSGENLVEALLNYSK